MSKQEKEEAASPAKEAKVAAEERVAEAQAP